MAAAMASEVSFLPAFVTAVGLLALASADRAPTSAYSAFTDAPPRWFQAACWEQTICVGSWVAEAAAVGVAAGLEA